MTESEHPPSPPKNGSLAGVDNTFWFLIIFAVAGLIIYFAKDQEVFPAVSIDLKLPKQLIMSRAEEWSRRVHYEPKDAFETTVFSYDTQAKTFLEYELGAKVANELMKEEIPIWSWRTRFCREFQLEELKVWLNPQGDLTGLEHTIENERPLPTITHDQALDVARRFVEAEAGKSLEGYKLVKDLSENRPKRTDYFFTWEDTKKEYGGARLRVYVGVFGNQVCEYNRFLYVPEVWNRKFSTIRSYNQLLASVATVFYSVLNIAGIFAFFWGVITGNIRWRFALSFALFYSLFPSFDSINNFAEYADDYSTRTSYNAYMGQFAVGLLEKFVFDFLMAAGFVGAAEALYRLTFPKHIAWENIFSSRGLLTRPVLLGLVVGYALCSIDLGWVTSYYLLGNSFGFWCPLGVDNYQILSSFVPAFSAMTIGVSAAFMEESLYRIIGLGLMLRLTGNFWLANFFQAAAWGFMHSTYPQQPAYARGVELTLGGFLDGWILRRYGIAPCLVSHYLFDTFLGCKPLYSSPDFALQSSGVMAVAPFLLLLLYGFLKTRERFAEHDTLINASLPLNIKRDDVEIARVEHEVVYAASSGKHRLIMLSLALLLTVGTIALHPRMLSSDAVNSINRQTARALADKVMVEHGVKPQGFQVVASLSDQASIASNQYAYEKLGFQKTDELLHQTHSTGYVWRIRYFRPMEADEYEVQLDGQGNEVGFDITRAEDGAGASLPKEKAKELAENELKKHYPYLSPFVFDSASEQKRKNRTDWTFTFKVPRYDAAEAPFKVSLPVVGDLVSGATWYWDVPDKWTWERNKRTPKDEITDDARKALTVAFALSLLWWGFGVLRSGAIRWRPALFIGLVFLAMEVVEQLNGLVVFYRFYRTTEPVSSFILRDIIGDVQTLLGAVVSGGVIAAFALGSLRLLFVGERMVSYVLVALKPVTALAKKVHKEIWLDGVAQGYLYFSVSALLSALISCARAAFSPTAQEEYLYAVASMQNVSIPSLDVFSDALIEGLRQILMVALAAGIYAKFCPRPLIFFALVFVWSLVNALSERYWQDTVIDLIASVAGYSLLWFFIVKIIRKNLVAYFVLAMTSLVFRRLDVIVRHGLPLMIVDASVCAFIFLLPALYAVYLTVRARGEEMGAAAEPEKQDIPPSLSDK
ncbi:MAG TPA: type II CAAX endopeptidase family protein [Candidatus Obscuribacterales bacterium]